MLAVSMSPTTRPIHRIFEFLILKLQYSDMGGKNQQFEIFKKVKNFCSFFEKVV
jgi:hypothetical protein